MTLFEEDIVLRPGCHRADLQNNAKWNIQSGSTVIQISKGRKVEPSNWQQTKNGIPDKSLCWA